MKHHHGHLTWTDKLNIEKWLKQGMSKPQIARRLGVHHSTIYDECKRGEVELIDSELRPYKAYSPEASEDRKEKQKFNREQPLKIGNDHALAEWLVDMIGNQHYSPSAACALLGKTPETTFSCTLCRQTVYKYIEKGYLWPLTNGKLRYKGTKKRRYRKVKRAKRAPAGTSIEQRPDYINNREEPGHWEMDTLEGAKRTKKCMNVLTERVTREEVGTLLQEQTAYCVVDMLDRIEEKIGTEAFREVFKSITVDNGHEFSDCEGMERSCLRPGEKRTKVWYCHPRFPGERGSNEKQNQMLRWFFPKGTDFTNISQAEVDDVVAWVNNYPRLLLGWHTSQELFDVFLASVNYGIKNFSNKFGFRY